VIEHVRPKYALQKRVSKMGTSNNTIPNRRACTKQALSPKLCHTAYSSQIIYQTNTSSGTAVSQEAMFQTIGIELSRKTMSDG